MLKFKNYDSYLYGAHQLVDFVELRKFLANRGKNREKPLELVFLCLSESEHDSKRKHYEFPPLVRELAVEERAPRRMSGVATSGEAMKRSADGSGSGSTSFRRSSLLMRAHT